MTKTAFIFPGQGSQSVGMLKDYANDYPEIKTTFTQASDAIGYDVWDLCQNGPEERLNKTQYTQVALLTASIAIWRLWQKHVGTKPDYLAGHSLGEYSALVATNAIDFSDAVKLVQTRGEIMQQAVAPGVGTMAAIIGLKADEVADVCAKCSNEIDGIVAPANFNSEEQIVIAGHTNAVANACAELKANGAKRALVLMVSVPSHSPLMQEAANQFISTLNSIEIKTPTIPVVHNFDLSINQSADTIRECLSKQLYNPVRWYETIAFLQKNQVSNFFECGSGKVLTNLNKRMCKDAHSHALDTAKAFAVVVNHISNNNFVEG